MYGLGDIFIANSFYKGEQPEIQLKDTRHMMVILTDPYIRKRDKESVVVASYLIVAPLSSYRGQTNEEEDGCVLTVNDGNPHIHHPTYVAYRRMYEIPVSCIEDWIKARYVLYWNKVNEEGQRKLLQGLYKSEDLDPYYLDTVVEQLNKYGFRIPK